MNCLPSTRPGADRSTSAQVGVNEGAVSHAAMPFGGTKEPGLGREGGNHGIDEASRTAAPCLGGLGDSCVGSDCDYTLLWNWRRQMNLCGLRLLVWPVGRAPPRGRRGRIPRARSVVGIVLAGGGSRGIFVACDTAAARPP